MDKCQAVNKAKQTTCNRSAFSNTGDDGVVRPVCATHINFFRPLISAEQKRLRIQLNNEKVN